MEGGEKKIRKMFTGVGSFSISRSRKLRKWPEREKRREAETNFRPSSNRPWWSDKHRKRWVYHLRSYPLRPSLSFSLSLTVCLFYPTERRRNFSLLPFLIGDWSHIRAIRIFIKIELNFNSISSFFEFRVDRDFNIESLRKKKKNKKRRYNKILEIEYSNLFRTCHNRGCGCWG